MALTTLKMIPHQGAAGIFPKTKPPRSPIAAGIEEIWRWVEMEKQLTSKRLGET